MKIELGDVRLEAVDFEGRVGEATTSERTARGARRVGPIRDLLLKSLAEAPAMPSTWASREVAEPEARRRRAADAAQQASVAPDRTPMLTEEPAAS